MASKNEIHDRIGDFIERMLETLRNDEATGMKPPIERRMLRSVTSECSTLALT